LICGVPFRSLIAILVLIFNLLPQFGGIAITVLLPLTLLVLERSYALPLFLILLVLHTLHIFAVEPFFLRKRLRPNIGLTVALTLVFGAIFGFVGFLLAVPLYASVRSILQNRQNKRLIKRGLPIGDEYYLQLTSLAVTEEEAFESDPLEKTESIG
jgi:predicted PurR-regulated permease PerM